MEYLLVDQLYTAQWYLKNRVYVNDWGSISLGKHCKDPNPDSDSKQDSRFLELASDSHLDSKVLDSGPD